MLLSIQQRAWSNIRFPESLLLRMISLRLAKVAIQIQIMFI